MQNNPELSSQLTDRLKRFLNEGRCSCNNHFDHREKLTKNLKNKPAEIENLTVWLKILSDPVRLQILFLLQEKNLCGCELELALNISQPTVSYHLQKLRSIDLIELIKEGRWTIARIKNHKVFDWFNEIKGFSSSV